MDKQIDRALALADTRMFLRDIRRTIDRMGEVSTQRAGDKTSGPGDRHSAERRLALGHLCEARDCLERDMETLRKQTR